MSPGKRGQLALGAALATGVLVAVALGQEVIPIQITATVKVTPDKAGTPRHPRGVKIVANGTIDTSAERASPVLGSVDVWLPKGWVYNGAKHPACTAATLASGGPGACPPGSIMGGTNGYADPNDLNPPPRVLAINGGPTKMYFWVVLLNPARVQVAIPGMITKLHSPRWSYRLHANNPGSLQVVAGIPITLKSFRASFGRGDWIATTRCPGDNRWRFHLKMTYVSGEVSDISGSVPCRSR